MPDQPTDPHDDDRVTEAFRKIKDGDAEEELYFDAETGQLVVRSRSNALVVSQDHLPATQMAQEGFFRSPTHMS